MTEEWARWYYRMCTGDDPEAIEYRRRRREADLANPSPIYDCLREKGPTR